MSEKQAISNLYYEIALIINKELSDEGIITASKYYQTEKELLKIKHQ